MSFSSSSSPSQQQQQRPPCFGHSSSSREEDAVTVTTNTARNDEKKDGTVDQNDIVVIHNHLEFHIKNNHYHHPNNSNNNNNIPSFLIHEYYALRHGQSLANLAKIISSDPVISTKQHGLSDLGKEQVTKSAQTFICNHIQNDSYSSSGGIGSGDSIAGVAIFSSDFQRAVETATIFASLLRQYNIPLYLDTVQYDIRLRERYFGELNGGPDTRYHEVWEEDAKDANHIKFGVESANCVLERTTRFILDVEDRLLSTTMMSNNNSQSEHHGEKPCNARLFYRPWKVILVAHGDVLQILQTGFLLHKDASRHRSLDHLETATVRELKLAVCQMEQNE